MKIKSSFLVIALLLSLSSCYTNLNKQLDREVRVKIDTNIPVTIDNQGTSTFTQAYTEDQLRELYLTALKAELATNKVIIDDANPEFEIKFNQLTITESTKTETVSDTTSDQDGESFELTTLDTKCTGKLIRVSDGTTSDWYAEKDKNEKVKSSRTIVQLATGGNKEKNEYREKNLWY